MRAFPVLNGDPALHIPLAGVSYCDKSYRIIRDYSPVAVLEYVVDGEGYVDWNGKPKLVGKDSIYFLPRGSATAIMRTAKPPLPKSL